jgi:hypothetical protein
MFKKQSFQFPDEGGKFTTRVWEMPFTEDHEDFKTIMDKRYKKALRAVCQNLIESYEKKFPLQNESSLN